jgi:formylglycine-generating enzyme
MGFGGITAVGRFDDARLALEAATGGKNTLLIDDLGIPSVMVRIPCFRWSDVLEGGEEKVCSAFVVDGRIHRSLYISKYLNVIENERAYSLPMRDPAHNLTIDEARLACARKGPGWHLLSNAEWTAVAHWCRRSRSFPRGNNYFGHDFGAVHEYGIRSSGDFLDRKTDARVLTGSGPASWSHDGSDSGIFDLNGNVWDFVSGLRLMDGEIQVITDNDSALNIDESAGSPFWKAIDVKGQLVAPGSPSTCKYDGLAPGNSHLPAARIPGGVFLNTVISRPQYTGETRGGDHAYIIMPFQQMTCAAGITPPVLLKELGLYPASPDLNNENLFVRNYGERIPLRGGSWFDNKAAGLWELYMRDSRDFIYPDIGFRSAFIDL